MSDIDTLPVVNRADRQREALDAALGTFAAHADMADPPPAPGPAGPDAEDPTPNLGGRPPFEPTEAQRKQVKTFAAFGVPEKEIAKVVGISAPTLRKHFRHELDTGHVEANARVAQSLFNKATGEGKGAVTAAIFWLKTRAGWKETAQQVELSGPGGGPIEHKDLSARELIEGRLAGLFAAPGAQRDPGGSD